MQIFALATSSRVRRCRPGDVFKRPRHGTRGLLEKKFGACIALLNIATSSEDAVNGPVLEDDVGFGIGVAFTDRIKYSLMSGMIDIELLELSRQIRILGRERRHRLEVVIGLVG